jgi:hypothetical protein
VEHRGRKPAASHRSQTHVTKATDRESPPALATTRGGERMVKSTFATACRPLPKIPFPDGMHAIVTLR